MFRKLCQIKVSSGPAAIILFVPWRLRKTQRLLQSSIEKTEKTTCSISNLSSLLPPFLNQFWMSHYYLKMNPGVWTYWGIRQKTLAIFPYKWYLVSVVDVGKLNEFSLKPPFFFFGAKLSKITDVARLAEDQVRPVVLMMRDTVQNGI